MNKKAQNFAVFIFLLLLSLSLSLSLSYFILGCGAPMEIEEKAATAEEVGAEATKTEAESASEEAEEVLEDFSAEESEYQAIDISCVTLNIFPPDHTGIPRQIRKDVEVSAKEGGTKLIIQLNSGVEFKGTVIDWDGNTLPVTVQVRVPDTILEAFQETGEDGTFDMRLTKETYVLSLFPGDKGIPPYMDTSLVVESDIDDKISLSPAISLAGRIIFANGQGIEGLMVFAVESKTSNPSTIGTTDADGAFLIRMYPGTYNLRVEPTDSRPLPALELMNITMTADTEKDVVYPDFGEPVILSGRVEGDGVPVDDAQVVVRSEISGSVFNRGTVTDEGGRYKMEILKGRYSVVVRPPFNSTLSANEVVLDIYEDKVQDFQLKSKVSLSGCIKGSDGTPLSGVNITATIIIDETFTMDATFTYFTVTDSLGCYTLSLDRGYYMLDILPPAEVEFSSQEVGLELNGDKIEDVTLKKGIPLHGLIYDPSGIPVPNTYIEAVGPTSDKVLGRGVSNEEGAYRIILPK